jgi:hypothetical protein
MRSVFAVALILATSPAFAQQQPPTPAEMRGIAAALSAQVDAARNLHLQSEAKAATLAEENAKLRARVQELEKLAEKPVEK